MYAAVFLNLFWDISLTSLSARFCNVLPHAGDCDVMFQERSFDVPPRGFIDMASLTFTLVRYGYIEHHYNSILEAINIYFKCHSFSVNT